jgi:hypothetical protein
VIAIDHLLSAGLDVKVHFADRLLRAAPVPKAVLLIEQVGLEDAR